MPGSEAGEGSRPDWYDAGLAHVWLPYAQMKTARAPLAVARTHGSRIVLADGRELIDGIASWWTACHGYNHPHIRQAVERQLALMPHVMLGGLVHEQALTLARRLAALLPGDLERVFFSESGSVAVEVAMKMAVQFWLNRGVRTRSAIPRLRGRLSRRHHRRDGGLRSRGRHARAVQRAFARAPHRRPAAGRGQHRGLRLRMSRAPRRRARRHHRRAAGAGRRRHALSRSRRCCAGCATAADRYRAAPDLRRDLHRLRPHRQPCSPARRPA